MRTDLVPVCQAIQSVTGKRFHKNVVLRWHFRGCNGVQLWAIQTKEGLMTTIAHAKAFARSAQITPGA